MTGRIPLFGDSSQSEGVEVTPSAASSTSKFELSEVPAYDGIPYAVVNGNFPFFTDADLTTEPFEAYSPLDGLGRCGVAYANICPALMPTEKRGNIQSVKPTGWRHVEYDFVDGGSLYNRCHLIAHSLAGEDANERNLITGTRYMNTEGMVPFENMVYDHVKETGGHVLYRVTPVFKDEELVARGVLIEAFSVEDGGEGVSFCVFCYNVQPGVVIDYPTGDSYAEGADVEVKDYILNTKSKKFHLPTCEHVAEISASAKREFLGTRRELIDEGYVPCGGCDP
ncbi:MAG: DNA/RNA non-specific endonuclease [Clostridia bacterium]|nr:DNA/RNA non-specific endonuclease [Clostridia bacterium]